MRKSIISLSLLCLLTIGSASADRLPWNQFGKNWVRNHDFFITSLYASNSPVNLDNGLYEDCGFNTLCAKQGPAAGYELPNHAPSVGLYKNAMLDANLLSPAVQDLVTATSTIDEDCAYFMRDEPDYINDPSTVPARVDLIPDLTDLADWIRANRPNALVHINVDSASTEPYVGPPYALPINPLNGKNMSRDEYILSSIKPDIHWWDHYPYKGTELYPSGEDGLWFACLVGGKHSADEYGIPYACVVGAFRDSYPEYRDPSESELRMNVFSSLACGYKGLNYFYFNPWPSDRADYGILYKDGTPTPMYYWIKEINPEVRTLGEYLRFLECRDYRFISGKTNGVMHAIPYMINWWVPGPPVSYYVPTFQFFPNATGNSHITAIAVNGDGDKKDGSIGFFTDDGGRNYFMLTNLYRGIGLDKTASTLSFTITFDSTVNTIYRINRLTGQEETLNLTNHQYTATLPGGTGDLFAYDHFDLAIPSDYPRGIITTGTYVNATTTLTLAARAGTTGMRFRNRLGPWSNWEPYSTTKSWTLSGPDGPTMVYVQYRKIDKMSASYGARTILDTVVPTPGTASSPTTASGSITVTYSGASDTTSGLKTVELWYKKNAGSWTNSGLISTSTSGSFAFVPSGSGTYYFGLVAEDNAGNRSAIPAGSGNDSTVYAYEPIIFTDNFDSGNTTYINSNLSLRQGGSVGLVGYDEWYKYSGTPTNDYECQIKSNALYLEPGGSAHNYATLCSPNHDFALDATKLDIAFRMKPPADPQGCIGVVVGAPEDQYITANFPATNKGIGIRVWPSGQAEIFSGGDKIGNQNNSDANGDGWYDIRIAIETPSWAGGTATVKAWIDNVLMLSTTKQMWENYLTFQNEVSNNRTTPPDDGGYIDDLVIKQMVELPVPISIAEIKAAANNTPVATSGVVTADFGDYFYIEAEDRSIGIRVAKTAHGTSVKRKIQVSGSVSTLPTGERVIDAGSVDDIGGPITIYPLGTNNKNLGGGGLGAQLGVAGGAGLNNIGLFIRTTGRVSNGSGATFSLDDGSGVAVDATLSSGISLPGDGTYVGVSGIVSCNKDASGNVQRVVLVTSLTSY